MKSKKSILLIGLVSLMLISFGTKVKIEFKRIKVFNEQVEIDVPFKFTILKDFEVQEQYSMVNLPKIVFGNNERSVRLAFDIKPGIENPLALLYIFPKKYKSTHPDVQWKRDEIVEINGINMGYFEYLTKTNEKTYNLLFYTNFKGQLLIGQFICPKKGHRKWKGIAKKVMNSLVINPNK